MEEMVDEAKVITGDKDAIEDYEDQLSNNDARIEAVQKSISVLDESGVNDSEIRRKPHFRVRDSD